MTAPLAGLRVLDLTSGPAGGLATMILADYGADVLRFVDAAWNEFNQHPASRMWLRGKKTARTPVHDEIKDADVLVISHPNGFSGCSYDELHRINPALIYAEISAFGDGSNVPVSETLVAAKLGRMKGMEGILKTPGPKFSAVPVATHATSQNVVSGILAGLYERNRSGEGQRVSTSLARGLSPYEQGACIGMQVRLQNGTPAAPVDQATIMPTLNYHPVQCADGKWIQLGNLLPHLFANFMRVVGLEGEISKLPEGREEVRDAILKRMQEKSRNEWMALFIEDAGVAAHPYQTAEEALSDPDMVNNGHVIELDGMKQLGPLARMTATPAAIGQSVTGDRWRLPPRAEAPDTRAPLRNVTVVELATIIAAPLAASYLADLGARVIKVESPGGDPYRNMTAGFGAIRCNQGKESIGVDLKADEGRAIVHRLIAGADILIHNFRPGVPERLGISYEQLSTINPKLIYISANGYGAEGPSAQRPSTHPIPGAALGGAGYQAGGTPEDLLDLPALREAARRLMRANEVNPDPNTAMVICTSALLGLIARMKSGRGQQIFGDMFIANAYANFDDCISFPDKRPRRPLMPDLTGVHPLRRLYPCSEGWAFLGIYRLEDWERFCEIVDARHLLSHYPQPGEYPPDVLNDELAQLLASDTAEHWERLLLPQGIGCVIADQYNLSEALLAQCNEQSELMVRVDSDIIGPYYRPVPMLDFSRSRLRPAGTVKGGANTRALVTEVGYDDDAIDALFQAGVLWTAD